MQVNPSNFNLSQVLRRTQWAKEVLENAHKLIATANASKKDSKERLEKCLCPVCFSRPYRVGGASITVKPCDSCGRELTFSSTATDCLCIKCAKTYKVCKECTADLFLKTRRKL